MQFKILGSEVVGSNLCLVETLFVTSKMSGPIFIKLAETKFLSQVLSFGLFFFFFD